MQMEKLEKLETMVAPSALTGVGRLCYGFGRRLRRRMVLGATISGSQSGYYGCRLSVVGWKSMSEVGSAPINGVEPSVEIKGGKMAGTTGFEPATSDVTGRRSNQTELRPRFVTQTF
jgi:hypothetical protein